MSYLGGKWSVSKDVLEGSITDRLMELRTFYARLERREAGEIGVL